MLRKQQNKLILNSHPEAAPSTQDFWSPRTAHRKHLHRHVPRIGQCLPAPRYHSFCISCTDHCVWPLCNNHVVTGVIARVNYAQLYSTYSTARLCLCMCYMHASTHRLTDSRNFIAYFWCLDYRRRLPLQLLADSHTKPAASLSGWRYNATEVQCRLDLALEASWELNTSKLCSGCSVWSDVTADL